jgi:hypothetical protein
MMLVAAIQHLARRAAVVGEEFLNSLAPLSFWDEMPIGERVLAEVEEELEVWEGCDLHAGLALPEPGCAECDLFYDKACGLWVCKFCLAPEVVPGKVSARTEPVAPFPGLQDPFERPCVCGSTSCAGTISTSIRAADPAHACWCAMCNPGAWWMITCADCGDKRCPRAGSHRLQCQRDSSPIPPAAAPSGDEGGPEEPPSSGPLPKTTWFKHLPDWGIW